MLDTFRTLSLFPELFTYELAGVALLRIFLGASFIVYGYNKLIHKRKYYQRLFSMFNKKTANILPSFIGAIELIGGVLLVVGLYTQAVASLFALLAIIASDLKSRNPKTLPYNEAVYLSLFVISLSLLFLGPGIFAFDYPL